MRRGTRWFGTAAAALAAGLLAASPASAAYEQVDTFAGTPGVLKKENDKSWPEEVQLGGVSGMAVNYTGAGGVPAGTVYAAGIANEVRVARFNPDGEFREAWTFEGSPPKERCGPEGDPAHPVCPSRPTGGGVAVDVDVDQTTGNVYVLNAESSVAGTNVIHVYSPDGSKLIAEFGAVAVQGETTAASPDKIHQSLWGGLAVDAEGSVYLFDYNPYASGFYHRLMVFQPQTPGDYEHYVYAGQSSDVWAGFHGQTEYPSRPVVDSAGDIYVAGEDFIAKLDPEQPAAPALCEFKFPKGGMRGMTVNPQSGAVFFFTINDRKVHQLSACDAEGKFTEVGKFSLAPKRDQVEAMAVNPVRQFEPSRSAGVLYVGSPSGEGGVTKGTSPNTEKESALGYVFAPPKELAPEIISQSVSAITSSSARLEGSVNPNGSTTTYAFQYLDDTAYEANEPDERQALSVSASGGLFGLAFKGTRLGGEAIADLSSGSKVATALRSATATAELKAASGTAILSGAAGKGTVIEGSSTITSVATSEGSFEAGKPITGFGIPEKTTIVAVKSEAPLSTVELTISNPATESRAHSSIFSGSPTLTELSSSEGAFEVGQQITGAGIPVPTTIIAVTPTTLTLSNPVTSSGKGVALKAGSKILTSVSPGIGTFEVGRTIQGEGIPNGTKITAVGASTLTLSNAVTKPGSGVEVFDPGPYPLAVGERIEGAGIAPGTTITDAKAGQLTLSAPATASAADVSLEAGIPFDAPPALLREALEGLSTIGAGNVKVSGGPGDEAGSSPYLVTFTGDFENIDVPQLDAESISLSGGAATASVQSEHDGGGGFEEGALEAPLGGAQIEGTEALPVSDAIGGLLPDAGYHYRVLATSHCSTEDESKVCEGFGPARAFRTHPLQSPGLPDGRAFELVSPVLKHGGQVVPVEPDITSCFPAECKPGAAYNHDFARQISPDGNAIVYEGSPFSFDEGAKVENEYLARRTTSGWQTVNLTPKALFGKTGVGGYKVFTPDLSEGVFGQVTSSLSPEAPSEYENLYRQPSADPASLTPLMSETNAFLHRVPGSGAGNLELTYVGASTDLSRVFFEANDALTSEAGEAGEKTNLYEAVEGQLRQVNLAPGDTETLPGAVFGSGKLLKSGDANNPASVFTHAISEDGSRAFWSDAAGQVYLRIDGAETVEIQDPGKFLTASAEGSKVLLADGCLYDVEEAECDDLTAGQGGFQGIAGQSEDLSHVYFVDTVVLTGEEENSHGDKAVAGKDNLYAWAGGTTSFVATLVAQDNNAGGIGAWQASPWVRTAEASPAGRWLAFLSSAPLSGYNNTGPCKAVAGTGTFISGPCPEVFLYDSQSKELICPSCSPNGAPPLGPSVLRRMKGTQPRYLLDSGRLYFDSQDALSQFDTNGRVEDVYQYEPNGTGSCDKAGGCVSLISAGRGGADSNFLAIDSSGDSVFFTTRDRLNKPDQDEAIDLYVARVGGTPLVEPEVLECQGEACQPLATPPNDPTPGSSSFAGAGNVDEQKVTKKQKKQKKKKKRAKAKKKSHKRAAKHNRGGAK